MNHLEIPSPIRYNHGKGDGRMKIFHNAVGNKAPASEVKRTT